MHCKFEALDPAAVAEAAEPPPHCCSYWFTTALFSLQLDAGLVSGYGDELHVNPESAGEGWLYGDEDEENMWSGDVIDPADDTAPFPAPPATLPPLPLPGVMGDMTPESAGDGVGW